MIDWRVRVIDYDPDAPLGYSVDDSSIPREDSPRGEDMPAVALDRYGRDNNEFHNPELYLDDADWLKDQYRNRSKSVCRIASQLDVRPKQVRDALEEHEIHLLSSDDILHEYATDSVSDLDQTTIRQLYQNVKTPLTELDDEERKELEENDDDRDPLFEPNRLVDLIKVSEQLGVDTGVVYEHLREHGIGVTRDSLEELRTADHSGLHQLHQQVDHADLRRLHTGAFLDGVSESVSAQSLATEYGVPEQVVAEHCRQHDAVIQEQHLRRSDDPKLNLIENLDVDPDQSVAETDTDDVESVINGLWTAGKNLTEIMLDTKTESEPEPNRIERQQLRGRVREIRSPSDPRIPDIETDEEIEIMADGCSLLVIETGSIEEEQLIGTEIVPSIEEVMIDLEGVEIEESDEILLDVLRLDYSEDTAAPDLWLAAEDSGLARLAADQPDRSIGDPDLRDDAISGTMDPTPYLTTRQQLNIAASNLMRTIRGLRS